MCACVALGEWAFLVLLFLLPVLLYGILYCVAPQLGESDNIKELMQFHENEAYNEDET